MKINRLFCVIWLGLSVNCAEKMTKEQTVRWQPEKPHPGEEIIISYDPGAKNALHPKPKDLKTQILILTSKSSSVLTMSPMQKKGDLWQAHFTVPVEACIFLIRFADQDKIDDNGGNHWESFVYGKDERPVAGAHLQKSLLLQSGGIAEFVYLQDRRQAEIELEAELALFPASLPAKAAMWELLLAQHPGSSSLERVRNELRQVYEAAGGDEETLAILLPFFYKAGQDYIAQQIIEESLHLLPRGPVARAAAMLEIERENDPLKKAALEAAFERDFAKQMAM